jgi:SAM-dependent methyltransferase
MKGPAAPEGEDEVSPNGVAGVNAYDVGYKACPCFWGIEPGSLVKRLVASVTSVAGWRVLDVGCGEGKNASYLWRLGAEVVALEASLPALDNARRAFPESGVHWCHSDARTERFGSANFDLVLAYGLLHCLADEGEVKQVTRALREATKCGGYHIVCAFNNRCQDLSAHPGFQPCLLPHATYASLYADWEVEELSDTDLRETHPHNEIEHVHSMTRLIARRRE